ncbi:ESX secretion-associated protein EspG [Saccharopolyspora oryzae]|uniref:ESX secretion-associated protein EspG n=1 Tax=Saccharopolyspora oryzae TaxID=2997343 RepID=A0ABT4V0U5_9PSEU|nr:ESX secretion-associated protein EspG [Saccharopolyspora oryzae]MDA3627589.1 ESX secretion-associated protein EspG [Saccharopolyspora oryzae]
MSVLGRWQMLPVHLDVVLKYLEIDGLTLPLNSRSFGYTTEHLGRIAQAETERMVAAGILVNDEVQPNLVEALKLLAHPYLWVDSIWFPQAGEDHCWRTVAAVTEGNRVVLGVQTPSEDPAYGGMLTVEVHENAPLPQVLLPTLPPAPPGNRGPARVPASSFRPAQPDEDEQGSFMQTATRERGSSGDREYELYQQIGKTQHLRFGQLAANLRDQYGRTKRSSVVKWFDNVEPDGRYLDHNVRGNTGEQIYMLTPADARAIGAEIERLIAQVR